MTRIDKMTGASGAIGVKSTSKATITSRAVVFDGA